MNVMDVIIVIVVLIFTIRGYMRGFINEVFSFLIIMIGLIAAFLFYKPLSNLVYEFVNNRDLSFILSFIFLFIFVTILLIMIRNVLLNLVESLNFSDADAVMGLVLGALKGTLLCGLVLIFLANHSILNIDRIIRSSFSFQYIEKVFFAFISILPDKISSFIVRFLGAY